MKSGEDDSDTHDEADGAAGEKQETAADLIRDIRREEIREEAELSLTPEQHQRLKDGLHGPQFDDLRRVDRRYLVVGSGSGESGERRRRVAWVG